jgi:hypothetical protein
VSTDLVVSTKAKYDTQYRRQSQLKSSSPISYPRILRECFFISMNQSAAHLYLRLVAIIVVSVLSIAILSNQIKVVSFDWVESLTASGPDYNNAQSVSNAPLQWPNPKIVDNRRIPTTTSAMAVDHPITKQSDTTKDSYSDPPQVDWGDSIFTRKPGEWDNDPIVLESHKLLFFSVPKVGCTNFKQLARRMMNYSDWATASPHNPQTNQLKYLGHYSKREQELFMTSPDWTRAVFLRDPKQRVLSAYMEKALKASRWDVNGAYIKLRCCHIRSLKTDEERDQEKGRLLQKARMEKQVPKRLMYETCANTLTPYEKPTTSETFGFDTFVRRFMTQCDDPHWRPQARRLSAQNWQFINFVGYLETVQEDAKRLLERIGAYEEYGAHGWGTNNQSLFQSNLASHKTSSTSHTDMHYHSNLVEGLVYKYYRDDYEHPVMNFTKPSNFEQVLLKVSGKK